MRPRPRFRPATPGSIVPLFGLAILWACGGGSGPSAPGPSDPPPVARLDIQGPPASPVDEGSTFTLTVRPVDASGTPVGAAEESVFIESRDPAVVAPVAGVGGALTAAASSTFRAVGPGTAEIAISYPCRASDPECAPSLSTSATVTVLSKVAGIAVDGSDVVLAVGEGRALEVRLVDADGATVPSAEAAIGVSTDAPEVIDLARDDGVAGDGRTMITLTGVGPGVGLVRVSHPSLSQPVEVLVLVLQGVGRLELSRTELSLQPGEIAEVEVFALAEDGSAVAGAETGVTIVTGDASVATVEVLPDAVPDDGRIVVRVRGEAEGTTTLDATYPGVDAASIPVSVIAPSGLVPVDDEIPGDYDLAGVLTEDSCGSAPTTVSPAPGTVVRVTRRTSGGEVSIRIENGAESYEAPYDETTGAWAGGTTVPGPSGSTLEKTHAGAWTFDAARRVVFRGTLTVREIAPEGGERCRFVYDVQYTRLS